VITAFLLFTQTDPDSSGGGMCK